MKNKTDAQEIAGLLFPEDWIAHGDFRVDNNAGRRAVAVEVAQHFMRVLWDEKTATAVMHAFYRREHGYDPAKNEAHHLMCHMSTALLAYGMRLKSK